MDSETSNSPKSPEAFRTISQASDEIGVASHVLRFWEGKFNHLRPLKRAGGRRFYRAADMAVLRGLKALLQDDGYTIRGVQKLIKESGIQAVRNRGSNNVSIGEVEFIDEVHEPIIVQREEPRQFVERSQAPNHSAGIKLRQALLRLEQTRMMLDKVLHN